jgi:unsaturated rhamnogalacturonyl hydrolase
MGLSQSDTPSIHYSGPILRMRKSKAAMQRCALFLGLVFLSTNLGAQEIWSKRMANSVMVRWPDGEITRGADKIGDWAYDKNVLLAGFADVWANTADPAYFRYIQRSMDGLVTADGQIPSYKPEDVSLDEVALGRELLFLYGRTRNAKYYKAVQTIRQQLDVQPRTPSKGFWHKKRYPNQMWLDGLYMAEPFYAQYASMFQQQEAFDDITRQFVLIESHTRDPQTGLLYHAWDESKQQAWANKTTGTSPNFWGRAVGWYAMALVDTLPYFPENHAGREQLLAILNRLAAAIVSVQDVDTGLWYQVLDKPKAPGNYFESSAACMFTYALAKGVRLGYLDAKYQRNALRAYASIVKRFVQQDSDGNLTLTGTVYGAGLGGTPYRDGSYDYYIHEKVGPNDAKGIGAFLLASAEIELSPTATVGRGVTVLLDAWFNGQKRADASGQTGYFHYKWNDFADSGFSLFGHIVRSYGAATATDYAAPRLSDLKKAQIYIIVSPDIPAKNPNPNYMQPADVEQIGQWVHDGGVLVLMENDAGNAEFEHFNRLSELFGIHFNAVIRNQVEGNQWEMGKVAVPSATPVFSSPHTLYMKEICTITPHPPARAILTDRGDGLMATAKYGKGMVIAVVDPWLYNEYTDGLKLPSEYDNYAAGKEFVRWLLHQVPAFEIAPSGRK